MYGRGNWELNTNYIQDITGDEPDGVWGLQDIANKLGITRERVRIIEASALKKLRHPKIQKLLKDILDLNDDGQIVREAQETMSKYNDLIIINEPRAPNNFV